MFVLILAQPTWAAQLSKPANVRALFISTSTGLMSLPLNHQGTLDRSTSGGPNGFLTVVGQ